jgi:hypothetical protein
MLDDMLEGRVSVRWIFTSLLLTGLAAGCGRGTTDPASGRSPESQCLQLHPSQGSHGLPDSWPDAVEASWTDWVEQLGDPISVVQLATSGEDAERAASYLPSIDADTPSAVCRVEFTADGHFMGEGPVNQGDTADVVLWEKDVHTFGAGASPKHGIAVAVLDPVTGQVLSYVERS